MTTRLQRIRILLAFVATSFFLLSCTPGMVSVGIFNKTNQILSISFDRFYLGQPDGRTNKYTLNIQEDVKVFVSRGSESGTRAQHQPFRIEATDLNDQVIFCRIVHHQDPNPDSSKPAITVEVVEGLSACDVDWNIVNDEGQ